jgi:hypothetical protein
VAIERGHGDAVETEIDAELGNVLLVRLIITLVDTGRRNIRASARGAACPFTEFY